MAIGRDVERCPGFAEQGQPLAELDLDIEPDLDTDRTPSRDLGSWIDNPADVQVDVRAPERPPDEQQSLIPRAARPGGDGPLGAKLDAQRPGRPADRIAAVPEPKLDSEPKVL